MRPNAHGDGVGDQRQDHDKETACLHLDVLAEARFPSVERNTSSVKRAGLLEELGYAGNTALACFPA